MKKWIMLTTVVPMLLLATGADAQHKRMAQGGAASRDGSQQRRPAEHWLENIRKEDPDEFERLRKLRQESPESFSGELRKRIRERMLERLVEQDPRLHEFVKTLPPEKQEMLMEAFRQLSAGEREGGQRMRADSDRPRHRVGSQRTWPDDPPAGTADRAPRNRAEWEKAYDHRTQMIEQSIDRIKRQLEGLERMLEERKSRRDEIIRRQLER